jgi:hypothetical protein
LARYQSGKKKSMALQIPLRPVPSNTTEALTPNTIKLTAFNLVGSVTYAFIAAGATEGGGTLGRPGMAITDLGLKNIYATDLNGSVASVDPLIGFTPKASGTYVVAVASETPGAGGTFTLEASPAGPPIMFSEFGGADPSATATPYLSDFAFNHKLLG